MNLKIAHTVIKAALACGVEDFCLCPGARNAPLVSVLVKAVEEGNSKIQLHGWFEERSASFFAIGKSRAKNKPVAVITTSGTAVGELLPAAMEAHYSGVPLLLISADRPRHYRKTGAPQCAEQVDIFGCYAHYSEDLGLNDSSSLHEWTRAGPAHINVCFDEPLQIKQHEPLNHPETILPFKQESDFEKEYQAILTFIQEVNYPFIVVGTLPEIHKKDVLQFLLDLQAPVYVESTSGLREEQQLLHLKVTQPNKLLENAKAAGYPIDGVLRIGGVPTFRTWRDLEMRQDIPVHSISHLPFSGLSAGKIIHTPQLNSFFKPFQIPIDVLKEKKISEEWLSKESQAEIVRYQHFSNHPKTETGLIHKLSQSIPEGSLVYLGNSLPIREWDLAATTQQRGYSIFANRGLNGIDGQLSTFLGLCEQNRENWAILGDLTTLYDLAGPWILRDMPDYSVTFVVINNNGGQIFADKFPEKIFLHAHALNFEALAKFWDLEYLQLREIPDTILKQCKHTLIEVVPE